MGSLNVPVVFAPDATVDVREFLNGIGRSIARETKEFLSRPHERPDAAENYRLHPERYL